jgi:hypothetical protein
MQTTELYFEQAGLEVIEEKFLRSDVLKLIRLRPLKWLEMKKGG